MKYVSIDIETSSLDPERGQILSIGIVIEDSNNILTFEEIPKFHCIVLSKEIHGEPFALNMNAEIIKAINTYQISRPNEQLTLSKDLGVVFIEKEDVVSCIIQFLTANNVSGKITIAGKNYQAFDKKFLEKLPGWSKLNIHRRVIDPATSFVDWRIDKELPDLSTCKKRAGLDGQVTHNALEDAFDVVTVLRTKY